MKEIELNSIPEIAEFDAHIKALPHYKNIPDRIAYCQALLDRLHADATKHDSVDGRTLIISAYVRLELAFTIAATAAPDWNSVTDLVKQSVAEAEQSRNSHICYHVLYVSGSLLARSGDAQGIALLQRAILYADSGKHYELRDVMRNVAEHWAKDVEKYESAILMFDWLCLIEPAPFFTLREKYLCMIQHGQASIVKKIASKPASNTCFDMGCVVAARLALNRRKSARKGAEEGLANAECIQHQGWKFVFEAVLNNFK